MADKPSPKHDPTPRQGWFTRFLNTVEWLGNLLPHPVTLFACFAVGIVLLSGVAAWFGLSAIDPRPEGISGRSADGIIRVVSLVIVDGIQRIVSNLVTNFTGFPPLGVVLVALLGVSIAEHSGLIGAAMRGLVLGAAPRMVTLTVVFTGIISNTASELGY
ncbi:MAG: AbgT family transporter, partial [Haliea sp.]